MIDPEAEIDYGDEIEPPLPDSEEKDSGRNFAAAGVNELIPSISPAGSRIDGHTSENTPQNIRHALYRIDEEGVSEKKVEGCEQIIVELSRSQSINESYLGNQIHSPMALKPKLNRDF